MPKSNPYPEQFRAAYYTQFAIPEYLLAVLTNYKRLNWSANYFLAQWNSNVNTYAAGTLRKYNDMYHVNFCKGCSLGKIKSLLDAGHKFQLTLSFRKANKMPAIVMVDFLRADALNINLQLDLLSELEISESQE